MKIEDQLVAFIREMKPIVWIGAGLSQDLSFPGWPALLDRLCKECGVPRGDNSFTSLLEQAEACRQKAPDTFEAVILDEFGADARPTRSRWIHRHLLQLELPAYVTTNFDHLLMREAQVVTAPECQVLRYPALGDAALYDSRPAIYHVHGLAGREQDGTLSPIVLTASDFHGAYGTELSPARAFISRLLTTRSVLFLGVGKGLSEDVYLRDILQAVKVEHNRWRSYGDLRDRIPRRIAVTTRKTGTDPDDQRAKDDEAEAQKAGLETLGIEALQVQLPLDINDRPSYEEIDQVFDRVADRMGCRRSVSFATGLDLPEFPRSVDV